MGIVVITIPGERQRAFVNALQRATNAVDLVVVQEPQRSSFSERVKRFFVRTGADFFTEAWYAILLRFDPRLRRSLSYFRVADVQQEAEYLSRTLRAKSANDDSVHTTLINISPDLLVVWGSTILESRITQTAKRAINLHFGHSPHYRGALANQHALLSGDIERIGATIHHINGIVDGGEIIERLTGDAKKTPRDFFRDLNNRAQQRFLDVARRIYAGEQLAGDAQENAEGRVLLLKDWSPSLRYRTAKKMLAWERGLETPPLAP